MEICITQGCGVGSTRLAAFDAALWDAGISGYNLIPLSSVIPRGGIVVIRQHVPLANEIGWRLYCVISTNYCDAMDEAGWVGLGWAYTPLEGGVLIEEAGGTREDVTKKIQMAYRDMSTRRGDIGELSSLVIQAPRPAPHSCAVVAAVFETVPWRT